MEPSVTDIICVVVYFILIKELHDSHDGHVGCACNDCNGSTICI